MEIGRQVEFAEWRADQGCVDEAERGGRGADSETFGREEVAGIHL